MTSALEWPANEDVGHKEYRAETHRLVSPAATVERVRPLLGAMGITRIGNVTGLDSVGIPTVVVCRPNSRSLAVSQGKGLTLDAAKASAVMESVEAYHAEHAVLPLLLGSRADLRGSHELVDMYSLPRTRGVPLDDTMHFLWAEGLDLVSGRGVWAPWELVHINSTLAGRVNAGIFCCSTNGLSSGNHPLEALSYALCEVIERDAMTLWGLLAEDERDATRVDLSTVDDPRCRQILKLLFDAGIGVAVWDMTSDVGLPAFTCLIADRTEDTLRSLHSAAGQGCHLTREIALLRALTEAAQTRLTVISGARDDVLRGEYDRHRNPDQLRLTRALIEGTHPARRSFEEAPTFVSASFKEDICWQIERLGAVGIHQILAYDLSKKQFGIPVIKVVVPMLEGNHSFPNYLPGARARARGAS